MANYLPETSNKRKAAAFFAETLFCAAYCFCLIFAVTEPLVFKPNMPVLLLSSFIAVILWALVTHNGKIFCITAVTAAFPIILKAEPVEKKIPLNA